jgi:hypothetical protein
MRKLKYQKQNITVNSGTADATTTTAAAFQLDKAFPKVLGVALYAKASGGSTSYDVKIEDVDAVLQDLADSNDLKPLSNERYKSFGDFKNYGQDIKVSTLNYGVLNANLVYQLVFLLSTE